MTLKWKELDYIKDNTLNFYKLDFEEIDHFRKLVSVLVWINKKSKEDSD